MKKKLIVLLSALMVIQMMFLSSCSEDNGQNSRQSEVKKIGIIQIIEHPSLDTIRESVIDRLAEKGYKDGTNISLDYQCAQGDQTNLKNISQKFVSSKYDLIIAIATSSAQAVAGETSEIPIVFAGVTDPVSAGLVDSLDKPGKNITGTSDLVSAEKNIELAKKIIPDIKTVAMLYNSSETNSLVVLKELKEYAKNNGLKVVEGTVTNTSEVQQVTQSLVDKADIIFSPTDNTVATSMPEVSQVTIKAKRPMIVGAGSMVKDGGLAGCGVDYTELGKETADMVIDVLNGKNPGDIPVRTMKNMDICVNKDTAQKIGVTIPEDVLKEATQVFGK